MNFQNRLNYIIETFEGGSGRRLSKKTGIPETSVREYRKGMKTDPRLSMILKLLNTYDLSANWLINGTGSPIDQERGIVEVLNNQINELKQDKEYLKSLLNVRFNKSDTN